MTVSYYKTSQNGRVDENENTIPFQRWKWKDSLKKLDCRSRMPIKWNMNVLERRNLDCFGPMLRISVKISLLSFSEFFSHFTEYYGMVHSRLFRRIPLSQLAYFQFPVISKICLGFGHKYNISSYLLLRR